MMIALHKTASTMPAIRAEIAISTDSAATLAQRFGIGESTLYKWKARDSFYDASHTVFKPRSRLLKNPLLLNCATHFYYTWTTCWPLPESSFVRKRRARVLTVVRVAMA